MAKIIYGVSGEGSGHSSRAKLVAKHLLEQGHHVKLVSYDKGYRNLKEDFDVLEIVGLSIASRDNKVSVWHTLSENALKYSDGKKALKVLKNAFDEFQPDCVLTDFEPSTAYLAKQAGLPLISIDNQHRMRYMKLQYPKRLIKDSLVTKTIIKAMVPKPWYSLIVSFHPGELKNNHCQVFPPILRPAVKKHQASPGKHILIYITAEFESLLELIQHYTDQTFVVYGAGPTSKYEEFDHIELKGFSDHGFLEDLASCKGVIATAGFTLLSESLYFKKPLLAFPMKGQFEQQLNAFMLDSLKLGQQGMLPPSKRDISSFLYELDKYQTKLQEYDGFGNDLLTSKLDDLLDDNLALLSTYRP